MLVVIALHFDWYAPFAPASEVPSLRREEAENIIVVPAMANTNPTQNGAP